jgi:hypothetical protein
MTVNETVADGGELESPKAQQVENWRLDRRAEALGILQKV